MVSCRQPGGLLLLKNAKRIFNVRNDLSQCGLCTRRWDRLWRVCTSFDPEEVKRRRRRSKRERAKKKTRSFTLSRSGIEPMVAAFPWSQAQHANHWATAPLSSFATAFGLRFDLATWGVPAGSSAGVCWWRLAGCVQESLCVSRSLPRSNPDVILCGWVGSKHPLTS